MIVGACRERGACRYRKREKEIIEGEKESCKSIF